MDYFRILKRSFSVTWRYRALWVFGIILALVTGGSGGGSSGGGARNTGNFGSGGGSSNGMGDWMSGAGLPSEAIPWVIAVGVGLACLFLVMIVVSTLARWVSETALIRMVDEHEETGARRTVWRGFRIGWSRPAWRLFLLDLLVGIPVAIVALVLIIVALSPLLLWIGENETAGIIGTVAAAGLFVLVILFLVVVGAVLSVLQNIWRRACVLEDLGPIAALRHGSGTVRRHWKDWAIMWLLMIGLGLGWALGMLVVSLVLMLIGVLVGGLPALLVGGILALLIRGGSAVPWIVAALIAVPIFFVVVGLPALLLNGIRETFRSSVWTLTYREARALDPVEVPLAPLPAPETPTAEVPDVALDAERTDEDSASPATPLAPDAPQEDESSKTETLG